MPKTIIACYSLPLNIKFITSNQTYELVVHNGGLQNGLNGVKDCSNFLWLGWPGDSIDQKYHNTLRQDLIKDHNFLPLFFDKDDFLNHYLNYCFLCLHPIMHNLIERSEHKNIWWQSYIQVNKCFATECHRLAQDGDVVWTQDFNLAMVPYFLLTLRLNSSKKFKIGFFCHTNFPNLSIFTFIPEARQLLESLASSDLVAFHCSNHEQNFIDCCRSYLVRVKSDSTATIPFGINISRYERFLVVAKTSSLLQEVRKKYEGKFVFFGCERADYIKGINLKMKAFDLFLEKHPELIEKCVLIQFAIPCKLYLQQMRDYAKDLMNLSEEINRKYKEKGCENPPIEYQYKSLDFEDLMVFYLLADSCVISSVSDGLNLISFEYVLAQSKKISPGVLILSKFAGAAEYFETPFKINPLDLESVGEMFKQVMSLSDLEKVKIQNELLGVVQKNTAENWKNQFIQKINKI